MMYNQKQEIQSLANQQASVIQDVLMNPAQDSSSMITFGQNQYFYYVVDQQGKLILGDETIHSLHDDFLKTLQGWNPQQSKLRNVSMEVRSHHMMHGEDGQQVNVLILAQPVMNGKDQIGTLYVGENISSVYRIFKILLIILIGLAVVFFGVALYFSRYMSKRALIPIRESYIRQREFVGNASHELRTPLSILLSSLDTLEMEQDEHTSDFARKVQRNMKEEVKRMTKLVSDLLTLARSDSNEQEIVKTRFDFHSSAAKVLETFEPMAASKQIKVSFHADDSLQVYGNEDRLTQLIYILVDNAIKYTPDQGSITVTLQIENDKKHSLCMTVQDTGIGIKQEDYSRIFERFYRTDKSRSKEVGGYGLGLSIAKWIVDAHHGTIQVASEETGSTFTVRIPNV